MHKPLGGDASLFCMKYKDKKDIYLLSTKQSESIVDTWSQQKNQ